MTAMTTASAAGTGDSADNSWDTGYTDGELDAFSRLAPHYTRARAEMAEDHDPLYAAGYWNGYEHQTAVLQAEEEKAAAR